MLWRIPRQIGVKVMFHWDGGGYGHDDDDGGDDIRGIKYHQQTNSLCNFGEDARFCINRISV